MTLYHARGVQSRKRFARVSARMSGEQRRGGAAASGENASERQQRFKTAPFVSALPEQPRSDISGEPRKAQVHPSWA